MPEHGHHHGDPAPSHGSDHFQHDFSDAAAWSKKFDDPERAAWQKPEEVMVLLGAKEGSVVADLGAGTGYFLPYLSRAVGATGRVLALDVEPTLVTWMTERAKKESLENVEVRLIPGDDPALDPASVDRILIVDTWHHIPERDEYSRKLLAALKPGGAVVIVDFTKESPEGPPPEHRIPPSEVIATLAEAGFTAEDVPSELPRQYVVVGWGVPKVN
ncbi:MAG: methyltransferase domain-containing protein [Deltaproteobacteria bacterium]|nr:methyltransferase domain-containing protein [Deltaproteobacteria bacterium]